MSTSTIPTALDALCTGLLAVNGLVGVGVYSAPAGDQRAREAIEFGDIELTQEHLAMGGMRLEEYRFKGLITCTRPGAITQTNDTVADDVRERAFAIWALVEAYLGDYDTLGGIVLDAEAAVGSISQGYSVGERWCQIQFEVLCRASITP